MQGYSDFIKRVEYDIKAVGNIKEIVYLDGDKFVGIKMAKKD